jgi:phage recombination protein Bet
MSNVAVIEPTRRSVTAEVAAKYGMEAGPFEQTLRATVVPKETTREEFAAFLVVARQYGLNPILKEIYAFPKKGGGIQPIVGVDGWANLINSHPAADGMEFADHVNDQGEVVAITCRIYRKDRTHPITATEYLAECRRDTDPWKKWPRRMLRHKAMIQAARYAFGFSGIIEPDEYDRFGKTPHGPEAFQSIAPAAMQIEHDDGLFDEARMAAERGSEALTAFMARIGYDARQRLVAIYDELDATAAHADAEMPDSEGA